MSYQDEKDIKNMPSILDRVYIINDFRKKNKRCIEKFEDANKNSYEDKK